MPLLSEFVFRLAFGLALAMSATSPKHVSSGYFRNHLYVLLGLNVLATLAALADRERFQLWPPMAAALVSYVGAVAWLYERPRVGVPALVVVAGLDLAGAWSSQSPQSEASSVGTALHVLDPVSGGLLSRQHDGSHVSGALVFELSNYGSCAAAEIIEADGAVAGLAGCRSRRRPDGKRVSRRTRALNIPQLSLLALRWLAGLAGMGGVIWMTWQTLKIPNTQSATGILYVGVILSFLGELVALLLSQNTRFPV